MKLDIQILDEKSELLKVLGHPVRLCIVRGLINEGENNVSYMQGCLDLPQSTISQHLSKLKAAGIIEAERKGTEVFYRVSNKDAVDVVKAIFK